MLFIFATPVEDFFKSTFTPKESPSAVAPASKMNSKFNIKYIKGAISYQFFIFFSFALSSPKVLAQT